VWRLAHSLQRQDFRQRQDRLDVQYLRNDFETTKEERDSPEEPLMVKKRLVTKEHFDGRFTLLQWMLGVNIAFTMAVLWKGIGA